MPLDLTQTGKENDIRVSEDFETRLFFHRAKELYDVSEKQGEDLFDVTMTLTKGFSNISTSAILQDSRIIKVLRYSLVPVISQMKLGQLVGLNTTGDFEDAAVVTGTKAHTLARIASRLVEIFNRQLDAQRFIWLQRSDMTKREVDIAVQYAKKWTCSLIANQNSATDFRNWRKELQETTMVNEAVKAGYISVPTRRTISHIEDLLPGQFSRECRVQGATDIEKADIVVRLKKSKQLVLIEAKAIGVRVDAFKRIKECREKFSNWQEHFGSKAIMGTILSGFIPLSQYDTLLATNSQVFWEHRPQDFFDFLDE